MDKEKLLLIESEMISAKGHFLDYLIETSNYFKNKKNIIWFLNKNFKSKNLYLPEFCNIKKILYSNNFKRKENKFFYYLEEILLFIKNFYDILYFIKFFFHNKKKLINFLSALIRNYLIIPRYFKSFYMEFLKLGLSSNDSIFFQSARRKDIALVFFLSSIEHYNLPKIHLRVFLPPNNRFKDFYFYLNKIKHLLENKIFVYTEDGFKKELLSQKVGTNNLINTTTPIFTFNNRNYTKKHFVGFIGEARLNKGFDKIPSYISKFANLDNNVNFIIQFSKTDKSTEPTKKILYQMQSQFKNIDIIEKYCDYAEYRDILKKITIMPFIYDKIHMNNTNSGIFYSCIANEIITIIPTECDYLKKILSPNSFEEANEIEEFVNQTSKIIQNYSIYLDNAKKSSKKLMSITDNGSIIRNIG